MAERHHKTNIRLASINIEGDKHLAAVLDFLKVYKPDVVCLQELSMLQTPFFERQLGFKGIFAPMELKRADDPYDLVLPGTPIGVGIFSQFSFLTTSADYYYGNPAKLPIGIPGEETTVCRVLLTASFEKDGKRYTVATTHFTRTTDGSASDKQRHDMAALLKLLTKSPELILTGDFNAPRGGEIFTLLAGRYKDNIPTEYVSSLDSELHKIGSVKNLMVDGLFTTPAYKAEKVALSEGVSDHKAITAEIFKL